MTKIKPWTNFRQEVVDRSNSVKPHFLFILSVEDKVRQERRRRLATKQTRHPPYVSPGGLRLELHGRPRNTLRGRLVQTLLVVRQDRQTRSGPEGSFLFTDSEGLLT